jgi:hypothetical protein
MSRKLPARQRPPGPGTVLGAVAALFGATACFVGCATEVAALGRVHQTPAAVLIVLAVAFAAGAVVLVRVAIRLEHRFRSGPAGQPHGTSGGSAGRGSAAGPGSSSSRGLRNSPVTRIVGLVIVVGAVAGLTALTLSLHGQAAQSAYTQHHGLARRATVQAVHAVSHETSTQAWTTYDYDVALAEPAGPVTRTVAHDPSQDFQRFDRGDAITVLVDPRQPDYAELRGLPVESAAWFAGPLILAVVFLGLAILITTEEVRHRRHRSATATGPSAPTVPGPATPLAAPVPADSPEQGVRALRASGRLADAPGCRAAHADPAPGG